MAVLLWAYNIRRFCLGFWSRAASILPLCSIARICCFMERSLQPVFWWQLHCRRTASALIIPFFQNDLNCKSIDRIGAFTQTLLAWHPKGPPHRITIEQSSVHHPRTLKPWLHVVNYQRLYSSSMELSLNLTYTTFSVILHSMSLALLRSTGSSPPIRSALWYPWLVSKLQAGNTQESLYLTPAALLFLAPRYVILPLAVPFISWFAILAIIVQGWEYQARVT